ncbi:MAG: hypothetical protein U1F10_05505 [Burkholderiales bacterium]
MATLKQLKAIREGDYSQQRETIRALLKSGNLDEEVVSAILQSPNFGTYLDYRELIELVQKTKSHEIYVRVRGRLIDDVWALIELMNIGYRDPEIEPKLHEKLLWACDQQDYPIRKYVVEALGRGGSAKSLRLLTELLDEHAPKASSKAAIAIAMVQAAPEKIDLNTSPLLASVEIEFVEALRCAIKSIADRSEEAYEAAHTETDDVDVDTALRQRAAYDRAVALKNKAWMYADADWKPALQYARESLEVVLKAVCQNKEVSDSKSNDKLMVGELMKFISKHELLPAHIEVLASSINNISAKALHDQGAGAEPYSDQAVKSTLTFLDDVVNWFGFRSNR